MKAGDSTEYDRVVNQEQARKVAKHSTKTKSVGSLFQRTIKVSNSESHSLANWASTSDNYKVVAEKAAGIGECTNTTKSCNNQNTLIQKNEQYQDCNLQNTELDGTAVQAISIREHFELLDISQVSDFWDQVKMKIDTAIQ